jgi:DNA-binding CsgD family transcriptional regulator
VASRADGPSSRGRWASAQIGFRVWSDPLAGLTEQERRILELIGEGLTNRQIGERLFLAEKTVKNYVSALFAKLGIKRRTQAAAYAARIFEDHGPPHLPQSAPLTPDHGQAVARVAGGSGTSQRNSVPPSLVPPTVSVPP